MSKALTSTIAPLLLILWAHVSGAASHDEAAETTVRQYLNHLEHYNFAAMRAMTTPEAEVMSDGIRLTHPEFENHVHLYAETRGVQPGDTEPTQFSTRIVGDIAYTSLSCAIAGSTRHVAAVLRRSADQWRIDRIVFAPAATLPDQVARQMYNHLQQNNFAGIRELATPGFEAVVSGEHMRLGEFEKRQRERPQRSEKRHQLSDLTSEVIGAKAIINFKSTDSDARRVDADYSVILQRSAANQEWKVERLIWIVTGAGE
ncbi:MAG: hypothetical protein SXG53_05220 [Pseudomonadota bacterium]|nr:hypothetical protein [Pseudomonadota bacterium]